MSCPYEKYWTVFTNTALSWSVIRLPWFSCWPPPPCRLNNANSPPIELSRTESASTPSIKPNSALSHVPILRSWNRNQVDDDPPIRFSLHKNLPGKAAAAAQFYGSCPACPSITTTAENFCASDGIRSSGYWFLLKMLTHPSLIRPVLTLPP